MGIISDDNVFAGNVVTFLFLHLMLVDLAAIALFPNFEKKIGVTKPWMVFTRPAFVSNRLNRLFYF